MTDLPVPRFDIFYRHAELTRLLLDYADARPDLVTRATRSARATKAATSGSR